MPAGASRTAPGAHLRPPAPAGGPRPPDDARNPAEEVGTARSGGVTVVPKPARELRREVRLHVDRSAGKIMPVEASYLQSRAAVLARPRARLC